MKPWTIWILVGAVLLVGMFALPTPIAAIFFVLLVPYTIVTMWAAFISAVKWLVNNKRKGNPA
jgi:hypothetical protein